MPLSPLDRVVVTGPQSTLEVCCYFFFWTRPTYFQISCGSFSRIHIVIVFLHYGARACMSYGFVFQSSLLLEAPTPHAIRSRQDVLKPLPFPEHFETDPQLEATGEAYDGFRAALMVARDKGLTKSYNRFHDFFRAPETSGACASYTTRSTGPCCAPMAGTISPTAPRPSSSTRTTRTSRLPGPPVLAVRLPRRGPRPPPRSQRRAPRRGGARFGVSPQNCRRGRGEDEEDAA